jgi:hypothetical protein
MEPELSWNQTCHQNEFYLSVKDPYLVPDVVVDYRKP